jgi:diguanylate cyclase (GGDEF)-like protein
MRLIRAIEEWDRTLSVCLGFGLIAVIGVLDYVTGYELSFFVLYLLPVSLLAWKGGRWPGLAGSGASAFVSALTNIGAGQSFSSPLVPYWNYGARFITFTLMTLLLSSLKDSISHLETMSLTDHLTGAANSRAFLERVKGEIERARRYGRPFTLSYLDLDNFKTINDTFGHGAGDTVLRTVVTIIHGHVRATDIVARLGGDEFALLLPEADQDAARMVVNKIRSEIQRETGSLGWPVTVSAGSLTCLDAGLGVDELIKEADNLMYAAKSNGKNSASFRTSP